MSNELAFRIPGPPTGKARARSGQGHHYTPPATRAYEAKVRALFRAAYPDHNPIAAGIPVSLTIVAEFTKARTSRLQAPTGKPDWDNLAKIISDALNGLAWHDDAQITDARVIKRFADREGVDVLIEWESHP
jgi:Holliday junction resolvase RusA-like endonuclease